MSDDFLRRLQEQQETFRRLAEGPLRYLRENEAAIVRMQELVNSIDTSQMQSVMQAFDATRNLPRFTTITELTSAAFRSFTEPDSIREMQRYAEQHRETIESAERATLPMRSIADQVQSMSAFIGATRFAAATIEHDRIGELIRAAKRERDALARVSDTLCLRHADLIASLSLPEGRLASAPPFASVLPTIDVFVHTEAVRVVTPHAPLEPQLEKRTVALRLEVVNETVAYLEVTLPELNPPFLDQYRGAKACGTDRGPDWWTHGSASLRKLLKGVLHMAAPNDVVLPWAKQNNKELDRVGRPTRATKVEWLCSFLENDAYRAYVRTELSSALALIDLFDTAQHVNDFPEFEHQYDWAVVRVEVAIRHILTIWKARRSH